MTRRIYTDGAEGGNGRAAAAGNAPHPFDRLPHDDEAEKATLGSMVMDLEKQIIPTIRAILPPGPVWFMGPAYQPFFDVLCAVCEMGKPMDSIIVAAECHKRGILEEIGGIPGMVDQFVLSVASWHNGKYYAEIVREKAILRELIATGYATMEACTASLALPADIVRMIEARIAMLARQPESLPIEIGALTAQVIREMESTEEGVARKLNTGFEWVDRKCGGLCAGQVFIVGARTSVGKTAWALQAAVHMANHGTAVAYFSLEMKARELAKRLIAMNASGCVLSDAAHLIIDDNGGVTAADIQRRAERMKRSHGIGAIVVDHLHLMEDHRGARESRQVEVSNISRGLKRAATRLDVPVIAAAQLNRQIEHSARIPGLADLRDSGAIEQDADYVLLLHRDGKQNPEADIEKMWCILAKNRHGSTGIREYRFVKRTATFHPVEDRPAADPTDRVLEYVHEDLPF